MISIKIFEDRKKSYSLFFASPVFLKVFLLIYLLTGTLFFSEAQLLPGFTATGIFNEQELTIKDQWKNVTININAPLQFDPKEKPHLVFNSLPKGNIIE